MLLLKLKLINRSLFVCEVLMMYKKLRLYYMQL